MIIGTDLLENGYQSMLPDSLRDHGLALQSSFRNFLRAEGLDPGELESDDPDDPKFHADVVGSAARWCLYWSAKGHPLEAYW